MNGDDDDKNQDDTPVVPTISPDDVTAGAPATDDNSSATDSPLPSDSSTDDKPADMPDLDSNAEEKPDDDASSDPVSSPPSLGGGNDDDDLLDIKKSALEDLKPLVDKLDQSPDEKYRTTMMMIQSSDDKSLISKAYEAAKNITDEKERAQALLDVVNEINYFTQPKD